MEQGEVDGCIRRVQTASMALSGFGCRKALVGTKSHIFLSFLGGLNGLINKLSHLLGPPFPVFKARYSGWFFLRDLIESVLISGCGYRVTA